MQWTPAEKHSAGKTTFGGFIVTKIKENKFQHSYFTSMSCWFSVLVNAAQHTDSECLCCPNFSTVQATVREFKFPVSSSHQVIPMFSLHELHFFFAWIAFIHRVEREDPSRLQLWVAPFNSKCEDKDIRADLWEHFSQCREEILWVNVHASASMGSKHAYIAFSNIDDFRKGLGRDGSYMNGSKLAVQIANVSRQGHAWWARAMIACVCWLRQQTQAKFLFLVLSRTGIRDSTPN